MVNLCSRGTVNIVSFEEGFNHIRVLAQMGHKSQLNLTIVSTEEDFALVGNKCLAQFAACSIAYWNILQVGIAARKSSRSRNCLVELAMDAMRLRIDFLGQRLDVGTEQFFVATITQDAVDKFEMDRIVKATLELHKHIFGRTAVLGFRVETQFIENHLCHNLRRERIEWMTCNLAQSLLQSLLLLLQDCLRLGECTDIQSNTRKFHICQYTNKRHLNFGEELEQILLLQHRAQLLCELIRHVTIFTTILSHLLHWAVAHGFRFFFVLGSIHHSKEVEVSFGRLFLFAGVDERTGRDGLVAKVNLRQVIHVVRLLRFEQIMRYHRVEKWISHLDAITLQDGIVVLGILSYLESCFVLEDGTKFLDNGFRSNLIGRHGYIPGLVVCCSKRYAHKLCIDDVQAGCLGVESPFRGPEKLGHHILSLLGSINDDIVGLDVADGLIGLWSHGDTLGDWLRGVVACISSLSQTWLRRGQGLTDRNRRGNCRARRSDRC